MSQAPATGRSQRFSHWLFLSILLLVGGTAVGMLQSPPAQAEVTVYKSQYCGCCTKWIEQLQQAGYSVEVINSDDMNAVKQRFGIPRGMGSCHTAMLNGRYVVEGHVPVEAIERLVREQPGIRGIAVPGMPVGSPGMEGPNPQAYRVLAFDNEGAVAVFSHHQGKAR